MNEPNVEQQHRSWLQAQAGWYQAGQEHHAQGCALLLLDLWERIPKFPFSQHFWVSLQKNLALCIP